MSISEHKHMPEPVRSMEFFTREVTAGLVCRGKGRDRGRELRRGRNGLWCRASPCSDPAAAVHLAAAQAAGAGGTAMFVPAVVTAAEPEAPMPVKTRRRVRRRAHADGIELEIAGVEVRILPRPCQVWRSNGLVARFSMVLLFPLYASSRSTCQAVLAHGGRTFTRRGGRSASMWSTISSVSLAPCTWTTALNFPK
jgi:hypothetical protein